MVRMLVFYEMTRAYLQLRRSDMKYVARRFACLCISRRRTQLCDARVSLILHGFGSLRCSFRTLRSRLLLSYEPRDSPLNSISRRRPLLTMLGLRPLPQAWQQGLSPV